MTADAKLLADEIESGGNAFILENASRALIVKALRAELYVWQPISTAPRDGTVILLRRSDDDLFGYTSATRPMKRHAVGYYKDFWISGAPGGHSQGGGDNQFTHWAPLPIGGISNPTTKGETNGPT